MSFASPNIQKKGNFTALKNHVNIMPQILALSFALIVEVGAILRRPRDLTA